MKRFQQVGLGAMGVVLALAATSFAQAGAKPSAARQGLEKLKALEGEWIDVDGVFGAAQRSTSSGRGNAHVRATTPATRTPAARCPPRLQCTGAHRLDS